MPNKFSQRLTAVTLATVLSNGWRDPVMLKVSLRSFLVSTFLIYTAIAFCNCFIANFY